MAILKRLLIYSGPKEWIKQTLANSLCPEDGVHHFSKEKQISATTIKDFPDEESTHG